MFQDSRPLPEPHWSLPAARSVRLTTPSLERHPLSRGYRVAVPARAARACPGLIENINARGHCEARAMKQRYSGAGCRQSKRSGEW